jgi:hypothetical protein
MQWIRVERRRLGHLCLALGSPGSTTACTGAMYRDGSANGFADEGTDSVCIIP